ncbi:MAG: A/G-specific adenine glycosylase [Gammaproteobacteria bacterium RIFCSPHIGHO2_12_FULL_42_10]|nr:MAG: A/G-specific adenine glycosylase [Gammaproteobacteria bacterium RIFCSPHIGHO2_12_FULL_42_10]
MQLSQLSSITFQRSLFAWFDQYGRHSLPWQEQKTPYRIWVSEIMLQQTQVNTVIPYFLRFMARFPDLATLALAHEDEVLHHFAGLGYYARARSLYRAAKLITNEYCGQFPATLETLQTLPGVGPSTAGAILSIAFNQRAPILDGNVKRVLTRLCGITEPINEKSTEQTLWDIAKKFTPNKRSADYTQAIMDFGATLCTRKEPGCLHCPFNKVCIAYQKNLVDQLPFKQKARPIPTREVTFLILKQDGHVLLEKRPSKGIWGGLYCLPGIEGKPNDANILTLLHIVTPNVAPLPHRRRVGVGGSIKSREGIDALRSPHSNPPPMGEGSYVRGQSNTRTTANKVNFKSLPSFRHTFTHYHLHLHPILIEVNSNKIPKTVAEAHQIWYNLYETPAIGLPKPIQSILRELA